ncbi:hypothetical protein [Parafrankia sp. EAN1pec]|uniref:hypothetical protein n=1 Tax=Parafrankia sp. (strain EAN1pec) TaxID=298653 RepID=UPI00321A08E4
MTTSAVQAGAMRGVVWAAQGLRVSARNALLADIVPAAYGFEWTMDNLGAIVGPLLALGLLSLVSVRTAMLLSVVPGLLASVQAVGNIAASVVAGLLYTVASPTLAFSYLAVWMVLALTALLWATRNTAVHGDQ